MASKLKSFVAWLRLSPWVRFLGLWVGGDGIDLCVAFNICGFALLQQSERDDDGRTVEMVVWHQHRRGRSIRIRTGFFSGFRLYGVLVLAIDCTQQGGKLKCIREWSAASVVCSSPSRRSAAGQIRGLPVEGEE